MGNFLRVTGDNKYDNDDNVDDLENYDDDEEDCGNEQQLVKSDKWEVFTLPSAITASC